MSLFKATVDGQVPMTAQEEADFNASRVIPPAVVAEQQRLADLDTVIISDTTIASLKAMTNADFDTWWSTNVTTLAQANNVLKRIARVVLRRVL